MNKVRELVHSVKADTRQVMKDLSSYTGLQMVTIRTYMREPHRSLSAQDAIRMRNFFRQHFPCEIDDVVVLDEVLLPKKLGLVKADHDLLTKLAVQKKTSRRVRSGQQ